VSATRTIFADIVMLAQDNDWADVVAAADRIDRHSDDIMVLGTVEDSDVAPVVAWARGHWPGEARHDTVTARSAGPHLEYGRVILVHPCTTAWTAATVEAARAIRTRPASTYLIALVGLAALGEQADLDLIERNVWRLLVDPDGRWERQDLAAHGIVVWGAGDVPEFLTDRADRDRRHAEAWLADRDAGAAELADRRTRELLDLAAASAPRAPDQAATGADRRRVELAEQAARDGRHSVRGRLDSVARTAHGLVRDTLTTVEHELIIGLPRHLARHRERLHEPGTAQRVLDRYLADGVGRWQASAAPGLMMTIRHLGGDVVGVFGEVNWDLINSVLPPDQRFPRNQLSTVDAVALPTMDGAIRWDTSAVRRPPGPTQVAVPYLVAGALGAALGTAMGGPVGLVVGGAVGLAGMTYLKRWRADAPGDDPLLPAATRAIRRRFAEANAAVPALIEDMLAPVRAVVTEEFDAVDRALASTKPMPAAVGTDPAIARLAALRDRLDRGKDAQ
jgi:hypothetical protein